MFREAPILIDKLEFLLALAREKHFGRAAEACGVTQPTLSAGVKQLEDSFGILLVNRGSRFQDFTPEGERVLDWARRIVGDTRAMRQEVHALKQWPRGAVAHRRNSDRAGDDRKVDYSLSGSASRRAIHHSIVHL